MKIQWATVLKDMDGKELTAEGSKPLTLSRVAINALSQLTQDDQNLDGEAKFKLGLLANKIYTEPEADFEAEEIAKVKERIGKLYAPFAVFQAYNLLK